MGIKHLSNKPTLHRSQHSITPIYSRSLPLWKKIPAIELRNVSYVGSGKVILHSISWTVLQGDHWALLGPNGSGKTTLLKIACGYLWPNAGGEVRRKGRT